VLRYQYDAVGNLSVVIYPDSTPDDPVDDPRRQYLYENQAFPSHLTGILNESGKRYATWQYDDRGRAISSEHAGGIDRMEFTYNNDGSTTVTTALGETKQYYFETIAGVHRLFYVHGKSCADCPERTRFIDYDAAGSPVSFSNFDGQLSDIVYDDRGLPLSYSGPATLAGRPVIEYVWHPDYHLPLTISGNDVITYYEYDDVGRLLRRTEADTLTGATRVWTYTYNSAGLLWRVDGPREDVSDMTIYTYNDAGDLLSITNAMGHVTQITGRDPHGRVTSVVGPNGLVMTFSYDARGRVVERTYGGAITSFRYDPAGNLTRITFPDQSFIDRAYDAAGRLIAISDNLGNRVEFTLDPGGNIISRVNKDPDGILVRRHDWAYDAYGRLIESITGVGQHTTYAYAIDGLGLRISETDPDGFTLEHLYDARGRLTELAYDDGGVEVVTSFGYDVAGNLQNITDPDGRYSYNQHDGFGQRTLEYNVDAGSLETDYDIAGNPLQQRDATGKVVNYRYDALGRILEIDYPGEAEDIELTYDVGNDCANGIGRLCTVTDAAGISRYSYDVRGNLVGFSRVEAGHAYTIAYAYDENGRLSSVTYPDGRVVSYVRDGAGRIVRVSSDFSGVGHNFVQDVRYAADGRIVSLAYGNGIIESRDHGLDSRLTEIHLGDMETWIYSHDNAGRITSLARQVGAVAYRYDEMGRLIEEETDSGIIRYQYDYNGNRLRIEKEGGIRQIYYTDGSNRMEYIEDPVSWSYEEWLWFDDAGRLLSDRNDLRTFEYYANGALRRFYADGILRAEYYYNHEGQRTRKILFDDQGNQKDVIVYHYDWQGRLLAETGIDGRPIRDYVWLGAMPVAQVSISAGSSGYEEEIHYLHMDHLNTPRVATDAGGVIVWRWDSDAFGAEVADRDPDGDGQEVRVALRFPGQYYDEETGLHYNYFRYYDPEAGRYITSDPIGIAGGLNTYSYVANNPIMFYDPYGLFGIADLPTIPQPVVDAAAGFGDALSFGFTDWVRDQMGTNDAVDKCSGAYTGGKYAGYAWGGTGAGLRGAAYFGGTRLGNRLLNSNRYLRIGPGRMPRNGPFLPSTNAPRISIGKGPGNPHIDLRVRGID